MASGKFFIHQSVAPLFLRLSEALDGHIPIINAWSDEKPSAIASLHRPSLYPQLNIPDDHTSSGDWGSVARGIQHLLSSLSGLPELRTSGQTETDRSIAQDINSELQHIFWAKSKLEPKPKWTEEEESKLLDPILQPSSSSLASLRTFHLIQLHRFALDERPIAISALEKLARVLPVETQNAKNIFDDVAMEDLGTAAGKARAASKLLVALGFEKSFFYLRQSKHIKGTWDDRSITYFPALESLREKFESLRPEPGCWLRFQLPYALPVKEGIYQCGDAIALVRHVRVINPRAGWEPSDGMRIETMMNPSGLYAQSVLELWLPGELEIQLKNPPGEVSYKHIDSYPEAIKKAVLSLNQLILGLRFETGRSDIPEVIPGDLNQVGFKQFDASGEVTVDIPIVNLELVRLSTGSPRIEDELSDKPNFLEPLGFAQELLESAKFQISAYNTRRAVLDFSGAFEAFVSESVTPRLDGIKENTRTQFLNRYSNRLSEAAQEEINSLNVSPDEDPEKLPSIFKQLRKYQKQKLEPLIDDKYLSLILPIMKFRNDAAHGRPIEPSILDNLTGATEALEGLMRDWKGHRTAP